MRSSKGHRGPLAAAGALGAGVLCLAVLAVAATERSAPAAAAAATTASSCPNGSVRAGDLTARKLREATHCLINAARRQRGLQRLHRDRSLQRAAHSHAEVMVAEQCFSHSCPGEPGLEARLRKAGYLKGAERWAYAQSTGCASSAEGMVRSWLGRKFHRRNLLDRKFEDLGVGVSADSPRQHCESGYATFTAVFGWRKP